MNKKNEIQYLTGIRGVAVLLVLIAHLIPGYSFNNSFAYLGMSLFFVLSGLVITYVWHSQFTATTNFFELSQTFFSFIWARLARLAPLYLLIGIPYFASANFSWEEIKWLIPRYLLGMQSWFFEMTSYGAIKQLLVYALSWSISSELCLYLVFPFLLFFLYKYRTRRTWLIVGIFYFVYCAVLMSFVKRGYYTGQGFPPSQTFYDWLVYLSPYGRIIEFSIGILIGLKLSQQSSNATIQIKSFHGVIALSIMFITVIALSVCEKLNISTPAIALLRMGPIFTLPIWYFMSSITRSNDVIAKIFSSDPIVKIGTWSYSIYLWQGAVWPVFGTVWGPGISQWILYSFDFIIIILLSSASYSLIEMPLRKKLLNLDPTKLFFSKLHNSSPLNKNFNKSG